VTSVTRLTRRQRRELHREQVRRRRRDRLRAAVAPVCVLAGAVLLLAGTALAATPAPPVTASASGIPLASPSTMAALEAGWQPPHPAATVRAVAASPASGGQVAARARSAAEVPPGGMPAAEASADDASGDDAVADDAVADDASGDAFADEAATRARAAAPSAPPVAVEIARIGVRSELVDLDLEDDRQLEVPTDAELAGWYVRGPRPGDPGPAVIAGHVDSHRGPAVFHRLGELDPGDEVVVRRADGSRARFAVQRLERWPKDTFPTDAVYREADGAELRLITCGGEFDRRGRRYEDNIIVFATAVAPAPATGLQLPG
jgi:hypothetical protein